MLILIGAMGPHTGGKRLQAAQSARALMWPSASKLGDETLASDIAPDIAPDLAQPSAAKPSSTARGSTPPVKSFDPVEDAHRGQHTLLPSPSPPPRSVLPYRPMTQDTDVQHPLAIQLLPPLEHLEVRRGNRFLHVKSSNQLQIDDVISSRAAAPFAIRFPGGQWLVCRGRLRLLSIPLRGQGPGRIQLALLSGELRAGATAKGRGVAMVLGEKPQKPATSGKRSRVLVERGEFRVRVAARTVEVEALDAYLQVQGPHASRTLTPGSALSIAGRAGFPRQLLPGALDLRPVRGCASQRPRLSWSAVPGARSYQVLLGADAHFLAGQRKLATTTSMIQLGRLSSGKYFWMVQALDQAGHPGQPSKIYSFTIGGSCS